MKYGLIRFSGLVRKGLRFRRKFESSKQLVKPRSFDWYPYDCFANLFYIQRLLNSSGISLDQAIGTKTVLDLGAADGALSFFLESLGYRVHACDHAGTNLNRMEGIRSLAAVLGLASRFMTPTWTRASIYPLNTEPRCFLARFTTSRIPSTFWSYWRGTRSSAF